MNKAPPLPMPTEADLAKMKKIRQQVSQVEQAVKPVAKVEQKPVEYKPVSPQNPCPVCNQSLGNGARITVVDGKTEYHTKCFVCVTCKATFGQFYYPHEAKPYCLTHYCAVRGLSCARCLQNITDGTAMHALDRLFHMEKCFRCGKCDRQFGPNSEFFSDGELPYCENHLPEKCPTCDQFLRSTEARINALDKIYHKACLICVKCGTTLGDTVYDHRGRPHCQACAQTAANARAAAEQTGDAMSTTAAAPAPTPAASNTSSRNSRHSTSWSGGGQCVKCRGALSGSVTTAAGQSYHAACFVCESCGVKLVSDYWPTTDGRVYCAQHHASAVGNVCAGCNSEIANETVITSLGKKYHQACLKCTQCSTKLQSGGIYDVAGQPTCHACATK